MSASTPVLCLIVAVAENGVIGRDGKMPWHIPAELKYFRARTLGKPMVMGRKTFQSIGKPLPGRDTIVVTRDRAFAAAGTTIVSSLDAALVAARSIAARTGAAEIMVIGGGEIFAQALPLAGRVYLTRIATHPEGDATFPDLSPAQWRLTGQTPITAGDGDAPAAMGCTYDRIVP